MREIKFRGKGIYSLEWIAEEGYCKWDKYVYIIDKFGTNHEVISSTVGQFTGLKDKNGVEIFEGDILQHPITKLIMQVIYNATSFIFKDYQGFFYWNSYFDDYEVIGNIYDNPELLEVQPNDR